VIVNPESDRKPLGRLAIAEEIGIDRSGASRYADRLQAPALVGRSPDP